MDPQVLARLQELESALARQEAGGAGGAALAMIRPMASFDSVANADANFLLTAAQISGGTASADTHLVGVIAAGRNAQLPTVASLITQLSPPNTQAAPVVGTSYRLRITNFQGGAFAFTVVTNTGWTLTGTMTIAQNTWREFVLTFTNVTGGAEAATLQSVATGTIS